MDLLYLKSFFVLFMHLNSELQQLFALYVCDIS